MHTIKELLMDFRYFTTEFSSWLIRMHPDKIRHEHIVKKTVKFVSYNKLKIYHKGDYCRTDYVLKLINSRFFIIQLSTTPGRG